MCVADVKQQGAGRRSRYYRKYGNPNFGGESLNVVCLSLSLSLCLSVFSVLAVDNTTTTVQLYQ